MSRPLPYILAQHDLPQIFEHSENVYLYVDDLSIVQERINRIMEELYKYTCKWHLPVNVKKTEYVIFDRAVQTPALKIA